MRWIIVVLLGTLLAACQSAQTVGMNDGTSFTLESTSFTAGATIPVDYTCDGKNRSPELHWHGVPDNTQSFVLIVDDPDAPGATWTHWLLFDIPGSTTQLVERDLTTGVPGSNNFGLTIYNGPCPPVGYAAHRYYFTLYALDIPNLKVIQAASRPTIEEAMREHVLGTAQLMGRYGR